MEKRKVFVIMPFQDGFFDVYETLKKEFMKEFDFSNANDEGNPQNIMKDVIQPIYEADIVLADLTGLNPNVMYELGVAHSFNKKTIVITQDDPNTSPFDLKQYRAKYYNTHFLKFSELIEYLQKTLKGAIDNTVSFGNPVMDFLNTEHIDYAGLFKLREENPSMEIGEAGFIDFLADIETDTSEFSNSIQAIVNDIRVMNTSINNTISEINRVNKTGGSGTASFIRKEVKYSPGRCPAHRGTAQVSCPSAAATRPAGCPATVRRSGTGGSSRRVPPFPQRNAPGSGSAARRD